MIELLTQNWGSRGCIFLLTWSVCVVMPVSLSNQANRLPVKPARIHAPQRQPLQHTPTFGGRPLLTNDMFCKLIAPSIRAANTKRAACLTSTLNCHKTSVDRYGSLSYQKDHLESLRVWDMVQLYCLTQEKRRNSVYYYENWSREVARNFNLYPAPDSFDILLKNGLFVWQSGPGLVPTPLTEHLIEVLGLGSQPTQADIAAALNTLTLNEGADKHVQERTKEITSLFSHLPGGITGISCLKEMAQTSTWGRLPYFDIQQLKVSQQAHGQVDTMLQKTFETLAQLGYVKHYNNKYRLTRKGKALVNAKDPVKELDLKSHDLVTILKQDIANIAIEKNHHHQNISHLETKIKLETEVLQGKQEQRASIQGVYNTTKASLETFEQENPIPRDAKGLMDWEERHMEKSMAFSELSLKLARLDKETELHQATQNQLQRSLNASIAFFRNWNRATYQKLAQLKEAIYQLEDTSHSMDLLAQFKQYCMIENVFQGEVAELNAQFRKMVVQSELDHQKAVVTMGQASSGGPSQDVQLQLEVDRALLQAGAAPLLAKS